MRYLIIAILLTGCSKPPDKVASEPEIKCHMIPAHTKINDKVIDLEICTKGNKRQYIYFHNKRPIMGVITEMKDGKETIVKGFADERYLKSLEEKMI